VTAGAAAPVAAAPAGAGTCDHHDGPATGRRRLAGADGAVVLALTIAGLLLRVPQLGPSSLWLDDAWLALAGRAESLGELVSTGVTAPGFAAGIAAAIRLGGSAPVVAQLLPMVLGVAAPPALYLLARRLPLGAGPSALAGVLVLAAPVHVVYSARVKPFSADAVLVVLVLLAGWRVVERPADARRWGWLALAGAASVVVSAAVAPAVAGAGLAGAVAAARHRPRRLAPALWSAGALAGFAALWWWAVVGPASTPSLRAYWAGSYVGSGAELGSALTRLSEGFSGLPAAGVLALAAVSTVVVALRRPLLAVLLVTPVAVGVGLAVLELAPLGGGRTDVHLYPVLALVIAAGVGEGARWWGRPAAAGVGAAVLAVAVAATVRPPPPYPAEDVRPLVEVVEASARPGDAIAVYSATRWAYALYTSAPVDLRRDATSPNGFAVVVGDPRVRVLGPHRQVPSRYGPEVAALADGHDRVWVVSSHARDDLAVLDRHFGDRGFELARAEERPGARLVLWARPAPVR